MKSSIASALAFALLLSGFAFAQDKSQTPNSPPETRQEPSNQPETTQSGQPQTVQPGQPQPGQSTQPQTGQAGQPLPGQSGQDGSTQDQAYQAELKRCSNASDRKKCVDEVNKKFGQM